jgi:hypothetical protein
LARKNGKDFVQVKVLPNVHWLVPKL